MGKVEEAMKLLEGILNDRGVPKNIKKSVEDSIEILKNPGESDDVKLSIIVSNLEEASSNDPNISRYARAKIWDVVSRLEELNK